MTDIESRSGITPLQRLHAKRWEIVQQLAPLRALHGNYGMFDAQRKIELSKAREKAKLANEALIGTEGYKKPTADDLDMLAHLDAQYTAFILQGAEQRAQYEALEEQLTMIDHRIRRDEALLRYLTYEPK